ncbi:MAG: hypothetical protein AB8G18_01655 [Gammaproteobacteria bacterium]
MILRLNQTLEDHKMQFSFKDPASQRVLQRCALAVLFTVLGLAGCASDTSFDRHNKSRLWISQDGKQLFFDASVSAEYGADDSAAESVRLMWMNEWLELRKLCTSGHKVVERRAIRAEEYNPMRHDLRYQVECVK